MTDARVAAATDRLDKINARIRNLEEWSFLTADQIVQLMEALSENRVSHRKQGNANLSYVEAHDIKNMLIRIFGFGMFSSEVIRETITPGEWYENKSSGKQNVKVLAKATVKLTIQPPARQTKVAFQPAVFTETAASSQTGADEGDTADFAIKTAESDAFKRAAIFMGTQFGLSLYANGSLQDQVKVIFEPTQGELLKLARERQRIKAFLASQQAAGAPQDGTQPAGTGGDPNGPELGAGGALAAGFAHPEGRA